LKLTVRKLYDRSDADRKLFFWSYLTGHVINLMDYMTDGELDCWHEKIAVRFVLEMLTVIANRNKNLKNSTALLNKLAAMIIEEQRPKPSTEAKIAA
jgi:hypothetical protein